MIIRLAIVMMTALVARAQVVSIEIQGLQRVLEQSTEQYAAIATFDDGSQADVSGAAEWSVKPRALATIENGLLAVGDLEAAAILTLHASYTLGDATVADELDVEAIAFGPDSPHIVPMEFATIQEAIDVCAFGDEVIVTDGVYAGPGNTDLVIFANALSVRSLRGAAATIIDGGGNARAFDMLGGAGVEIRGFEIRHGYHAAQGGAMRIEQSTYTVSDCIFFMNTIDNSCTSGRGGAVYVDASTGMFLDCLFSANTTPTEFCGSPFTGDGAALYARDSDTTVVGCRFTMNDGARGGAIYASGDLEIHRSLFDSNRAIGSANFPGAGGAIWHSVGDLLVVNSILAENFVDLEGQSYGDGAAIWNKSGSCQVINSTVYDNDSVMVAAIEGVSLQVTNSIVRANSGGSIAPDADVSYSNVQGGYDGEGNIDADPRFIDAGDLDFRLGVGSPVIDAASNLLIPDDVDTDYAGNPRYVDDPGTIDTGVGPPPIVDMGAHERQLGTCPPDCNGDGVLDMMDFVCFQNAWNQQLAYADCTQDGQFNVLDFVCFQLVWTAGCR